MKLLIAILAVLLSIGCETAPSQQGQLQTPKPVAAPQQPVATTPEQIQNAQPPELLKALTVLNNSILVASETTEAKVLEKIVDQVDIVVKNAKQNITDQEVLDRLTDCNNAIGNLSVYRSCKAEPELSNSAILIEHVGQQYDFTGIPQEQWPEKLLSVAKENYERLDRIISSRVIPRSVPTSVNTEIPQVQQPEAEVKTAPRGASAKCCDGTYSYNVGRGACSHHGGVCQWLN